LDEVAPEDLPAASPPPGDRLDSAQVLRALAHLLEGDSRLKKFCSRNN
jgi:hypothetical protein